MRLSLLARIRLARIQEKRVNRETFRNDVYELLKAKFTDVEISKTIKELSEIHSNKVLQKKQRLEREFLEVEKADDYTRLNIV